MRVRGVVTYVDPQWGRLFIQESDAALAVDITGLPETYSRGDLVDVSGWTGASDVPAVPLVTRATIERRGKTPLSAPPLVSLSALNGTTCDGRSLQTAGLVKELSIWNGYLRLHVTPGQHAVELRVQEFPLLDMSALVGATIQSQGVCVQAPAAEAKVADMRVMVGEFADLGLPEPLHAQLTRATAALPVLTRLDAIRRMSRSEAGRFYPVRVSGDRHLCRSRRGTMLFLQDGATGIFVALHGAQSPGAGGRPARGQRLDGPGNFAPEILRPSFRVLGQATLPAARPVAYERLMTGAEDSQWVSMRGVVRGMTRTETQQLVLELIAGGERLTVMVPRFTDDKLPTSLIDAERQRPGRVRQHLQPETAAHWLPALRADAGAGRRGAPGGADPFCRSGAVHPGALAVRSRFGARRAAP